MKFFIAFSWIIVSTFGCGSTLKADSNQTESVVEENESCLSVIESIVISSELFKEKVGDLEYSILLERSPEPIQDNAVAKGAMYEFNVVENLEDHFATIARFSFDPNEQLLYFFDPIEAELMEISFDRTLLTSFNSACK